MAARKGLTGDFVKFADMQKLIRSIGKAGGTLMLAMAPKITAIVRAQVTANTTPTGRAWKKNLDGTPTHLGAAVAPMIKLAATTERGFSIGDNPIMVFHQRGHKIGVRGETSATRKGNEEITTLSRGVRLGRQGSKGRAVPSRKVFPFRNKNLPETWTDAFDAEAKAMGIVFAAKAKAL